MLPGAKLDADTNEYQQLQHNGVLRHGLRSYGGHELRARSESLRLAAELAISEPLRLGAELSDLRRLHGAVSWVFVRRTCNVFFTGTRTQTVCPFLILPSSQ